jgi:hypothetical protein
VTPVNGMVDAILAPVNETADRVVAPVVDTVREATAPVADTVDSVTRPVADESAAAGDAPREVTAPSSGRADIAAAPSVGGGDGPSGGGASGGGASPSGDSPALAAVPGSGDDPLGSALDALASGPQPRTGVSEGPLASLPFGDATFSAVPFAAPPGGTAATSAPGASDPTVIDTIVDTAIDPQVLAATAVAFTIGVTLRGSRLLCSGEGQLMFSNVRLLPCLIRDSVQHHIAPLASALPASGAAAPAAALSPPQGAVKGGSGSNAGVPDGHRGLSGLAQSFRDGFEDALGGGNREIGDALGDSRLMIQIGMALGFLYAAFLSVWFWATRLRGRPGREEEGT